MKENIDQVKAHLDKLIGGRIRRVLLNKGFIWPGNPGRIIADKNSWIEYTKDDKFYELGMTIPQGNRRWITHNRVIKGLFNFRVIQTNRGRNIGVDVISGQTYVPEYLGEIEEVRAYSIVVDESEIIGQVLIRTNDKFVFRIERSHWGKYIEHEWMKTDIDQMEFMMEDDEYNRVH